MKVQALVLGKYGTTSTFRLYRFPMPVSPPLNSSISTVSITTKMKQSQGVMYYYCLEDLEHLAILAPVSSLRHVNTIKLYRGYPGSFCKNVIDGYTYANIHVLYELATIFKSKLLMNLCQLTEHTPLTERYSLLQRIPLLDSTPPPYSPSLSSSTPLFGNSFFVDLVEHVLHPVRLDGQEWFLQPWTQQHEQPHEQPQQREQQQLLLSPPQNERIPNVSVTDMNSRTKESSLLLQRRLAPKLGHHALHLTIHTPTYKDHHHLHSIQSAPLRKSIYKQQINKRLQIATVAAAAAATTTHPSRLSAIGPSQIESTQSSLQKNREPSDHPTSPPTMRTFEQIYHTLEHTRTQKYALGDTIRQMSIVLGDLQQSLMPRRIDDQMTKQMDEWMAPYLEQMEKCMNRLLTLETKAAIKQPISTTATSSSVPANSINKVAMKVELLTLMHRLDQLERKQTASHLP